MSHDHTQLAIQICIIKCLHFRPPGNSFCCSSSICGGARRCNFQASERPWAIRFFYFWLSVREFSGSTNDLKMERKVSMFSWASLLSTKLTHQIGDSDEICHPWQSSAFLAVHHLQGCHAAVFAEKQIHFQSKSYMSTWDTCHDTWSLCHVWVFWSKMLIQGLG